MKKTYTTSLPDKAGAFQSASEIIFSLGLNITRVSYNKAVDLHLLFLEVEGDEKAIGQATILLNNAGYILNSTEAGNMMVIDFILPDVPGAVLPVLRLINAFHFNISYISAQADGSGYQRFRMGFLVERKDEVRQLLQKASTLCELDIISYNQCGQVLDNTVFYLTFANAIAERLSLGSRQKMELIVQSNLIMELLRDTPNAQYETFDFIKKFAENMCVFHGTAFCSRLSQYDMDESLRIYLIEPPCGSNICILNCAGRLIVVDGGFRCYRNEALAQIKALFPDFESCEKTMILTHADVDHCGIAESFSRVCTSRTCCKNFSDEAAGRDNLREQNPVHAPYVRISKLLSDYRSVAPSSLCAIGERPADCAAPLVRIGTLALYGLEFEVYEGKGGHTPGEILLVERRYRLVFSGDIFINVKDCIPAQHEFNLLAPYLMTSVDTDPSLAKQEREAIFQLLGPGEWNVFGGHGNLKKITL